MNDASRPAAPIPPEEIERLREIAARALDMGYRDDTPGLDALLLLRLLDAASAHAEAVAEIERMSKAMTHAEDFLGAQAEAAERRAEKAEDRATYWRQAYRGARNEAEAALAAAKAQVAALREGLEPFAELSSLEGDDLAERRVPLRIGAGEEGAGAADIGQYERVVRDPLADVDGNARVVGQVFAEGLDDALAFARGDESRATLHHATPAQPPAGGEAPAPDAKDRLLAAHRGISDGKSLVIQGLEAERDKLRAKLDALLKAVRRALRCLPAPFVLTSFEEEMRGVLKAALKEARDG